MSQNKKSNQALQTNRKAWSVVYPIFLYFAACQIVNLFVGMLPFAASVDAVKRQGLGSLLGGIVLYMSFVRGMSAQSRGEHRLFASPVSGKTAAGIAASVFMLSCSGIAMNNLLAWTNLRQLSDSYQTVEQAFYSSSLGWEILALGVITPIAEELLYRYIVFYNLRSWQGRTTAIVGSALIFGLIHMNIVQTVYAFALGLALGILMEYYQDVRVAVCGHVAANILSLLRGETSFLSWLKPGDQLFLPVTLGLFVAVGLVAIWHVVKFKNE